MLSFPFTGLYLYVDISFTWITLGLYTVIVRLTLSLSVPCSVFLCAIFRAFVQNIELRQRKIQTVRLRMAKLGKDADIILKQITDGNRRSRSVYIYQVHFPGVVGKGVTVCFLLR